MTNGVKETIISSLKECDSHISKIHRAKDLLSNEFPLSEERFSTLNEEKIEHIFRNLRNNLAHDYPESIKQTVDTLNILYKNFGKFEDLYSKVKRYWLSVTGG